MQTLIGIINIVLPVFLTIGLGYLLKSISFLTSESNKVLSRFIFYVATPLLLFRSAATTPISEALNLSTITVVLILTVIITFIVYLFCARTVPSRRGVITQASFRSNLVYFGLVVISNALGEKGVSSVVYLITLLIILYNFLAIIVLTLPHRNGRQYGLPARTLILDIIKNPLVLASTAGFLASISGVGLPVSIDDTLRLVGRTALPLALIVVGGSLEMKKVTGEFRTAFTVSIIKLIVFPAIVYITLKSLGEPEMSLKAITILAASPSAVSSYIMAFELKGDSELAASAVIISTLLSFFTVTGWLAFFTLG